MIGAKRDGAASKLAAPVPLGDNLTSVRRNRLEPRVARSIRQTGHGPVRG